MQPEGGGLWPARADGADVELYLGPTEHAPAVFDRLARLLVGDGVPSLTFLREAPAAHGIAAVLEERTRLRAQLAEAGIAAPRGLAIHELRALAARPHNAGASGIPAAPAACESADGTACSTSTATEAAGAT